jgi:putative membrane protein
MRNTLNAIIGLLVVAHLGFFALEAIFWKDAPEIRESLNFRQTDQTDAAKALVNQGVSNAFLAAGLAWGLWGFRNGRPEGRPVLNFFLVFIALAGVVGWLSIRPDAWGATGFLVGQTGLALAALVCLYQAPRS